MQIGLSGDLLLPLRRRTTLPARSLCLYPSPWPPESLSQSHAARGTMLQTLKRQPYLTPSPSYLMKLQDNSWSQRGCPCPSASFLQASTLAHATLVLLFRVPGIELCVTSSQNSYKRIYPSILILYNTRARRGCGYLQQWKCAMLV